VIAEVEATGSNALMVKGVAGPVVRGGSRDVVFAFDTGAVPRGKYVLRIIATMPGSSERVERRVPFQVV
jgi:hypothetical protein